MIDRVVHALRDPIALASDCGLDLEPFDLRRLFETCSIAGLAAPDTLCAMIREVRVCERSLEVRCSAQRVAEHLGLPCPPSDVDILLTHEMTIRRSGQALRLVRQDGMPLTDAPNGALVRLVALGHRWWGELRVSGLSVGDYAATLGVSRAYVTRVMRLAFLSARVTDAILAGAANTKIGCRVLTRPEGANLVELTWREQEEALLAA